MSVIIQGTQLRDIGLGRYVTGKRSTLSGAATHQVFTVAGGEVLITALWGKVVTTMAGANTVALQFDPTTGDTTVIVTATDLGTTDTAAGTPIGVIDDDTDATVDFRAHGQALSNYVATTGEIEAVVTGAGADGAIDWYCTYVPLTPGATVVASA
jgi:hypothetical protein